jgi:hypothetical protein
MTDAPHDETQPAPQAAPSRPRRGETRARQPSTDTTNHPSSRQHLQDLAISDSGFIFDPYTGATFTVNTTGIDIIEGIQEGLGRDELLDRLRERYTVAALDDPARDLDEFLRLMRQHDLVDKHFSL